MLRPPRPTRVPRTPPPFADPLALATRRACRPAAVSGECLAASTSDAALSPATLAALVANAAMPAYTAYRYVQFALAPGEFGDDYSLWLAALMIAQLPLCLLGGAFAGVSYIEGPGWRRVLVYVVVVAVFGLATGLVKLAWDTEMGPILAWAVAMQLLIIAVAGPQPALARARIDAVTGDAVNLTILTPFVALLLGIAAVALQPAITRRLEWRSVSFDWSDLAWICAAYFALRAWSAAYVFTPGFEARRKGFFQRRWIEALVKPAPKGDP